MKKTLAIILALMLSLASVSFSLAETVEPTPLTWWCISSQSDFYNARAAAWNEQNPDRPIALETVDMAGSDRQTKLLVALQTGEGAPDYCDVNITAFGTFFDYEEIPFLTLTDLVADERDVYVQAKLDIYSTGGELYGAPSQLGGTVVYYNTDITEAAGVDIDSIVTWDDYVAAGKQVLEKTGKPMTVIETTDMAPFQAMVLQKGSDFLDAEGNVILDCETNIELLEYLKSWMDDGIAIPMPGGGNASEIFYEFFNNSGAASVILPMWYMSRLTEYMPDLSGKIAVRPMPVWDPEDTEAYTTACTGGNGAVITNQCESPELAKDSLYFCKMSYDAQVQCYEMLGYAPYRTDAWEDPALQIELPYFCNENVFKNVSESLKKANAIHNFALVPEAFNAVSSNVMYNVFETKTQTPAEALTEAAEALRNY